jgi:hypothetical protein
LNLSEETVLRLPFFTQSDDWSMGPAPCVPFGDFFPDNLERAFEHDPNRIANREKNVLGHPGSLARAKAQTNKLD